MAVKWSHEASCYIPGENMVVRRLPCVDCGGTPARYIERRLCSRCYHRKAGRKGLGRLPDAELIELWSAKHGDCRVWLGHISPEGYGKIRAHYAHRRSYELRVGPIPDGLVIDHLCSNRWCVEPRHLEPVTHTENIRRAYRQIEACPRGHAYGDDNPRGKCRPCARKRVAAWTEERLKRGWVRTSAGWKRPEVER